MAKVLLIEPDPVLLGQYGRILSRRHDVVGARNAQESVDALDDLDQVDIIVSECNLGYNNGFELLHEIRSHDDWLEIPLVLLSTVPPDRVPTERLPAYGVRDFLYKPDTSPHALAERVDTVLQELA